MKINVIGDFMYCRCRLSRVGYVATVGLTIPCSATAGSATAGSATAGADVILPTCVGVCVSGLLVSLVTIKEVTPTMPDTISLNVAAASIPIKKHHKTRISFLLTNLNLLSSLVQVVEIVNAGFIKDCDVWRHATFEGFEGFQL